MAIMLMVVYIYIYIDNFIETINNCIVEIKSIVREKSSHFFIKIQKSKQIKRLMLRDNLIH